MINEPEFPSVHSVYDYLDMRYSTDLADYDPGILSRKVPVQLFNEESQTLDTLTLQMTPFGHVLTKPDDVATNARFVVLPPFREADSCYDGESRLLIDDDLFLFEEKADIEEIDSYIGARYRLMLAAIDDGIHECLEISDLLYGKGYSQVMESFVKLIPEACYTGYDVPAAILYRLGVDDGLLDDFSYLTESAKEEARSLLFGDDDLFNTCSQVNQAFSDLAGMLESEEGVNHFLSKTVGYFLYCRYLIDSYATTWENAYGDMPGYLEYHYVAMCVGAGRLPEGDTVSLAALTYSILSLHPHDYEYLQNYERVKNFADSARRRMAEEPDFRRAYYQPPSGIVESNLDSMSGEEFERYVARLFEAMGYDAIVTQGSSDQGVDVIASNDFVKLGIQVKRYNQPVGNFAVQEAVAGKAFYGCDKAMVVTNSSFTSSAKQLALANSVILWDGSILKEKISEYLAPHLAF